MPGVLSGVGDFLANRIGGFQKWSFHGVLIEFGFLVDLSCFFDGFGFPVNIHEKSMKIHWDLGVFNGFNMI
jgi:hypothetical protein